MTATVATDAIVVRQFVEIISAHAVGLAKGNGKGGALQLSTLSPVDEKIIPNRFRLDDVDGMVGVAVSAANAGLNVYIEARTVNAAVRGNGRGKLEDTGVRVRPSGRRRSRQGQGRRRHGAPEPHGRNFARKFPLLVSVRPAGRRRRGKAGRRPHPRLFRNRPGHRRRHPVLPGARHAQLPVESQTGARP